MGEARKGVLRVGFDRAVKLEFHGAKIQWHQGELFPRVGFIVTNLDSGAKPVVDFYNRRGTAEQWIKQGNYAVCWTRLSCHGFDANQVRLQSHQPNER
jgi:hypothetical protein